jgi:alpha-tubulin suppressor-like RCC1 family protein
MRRLLALLAFVVVASCNDDGLTDPGSVFGLELVVTPASDTLVASTSLQLSATATRNGVPLAALPGHVWESNNPAVATVDQNGKVLAVSPGTADIAVRVNSVRGYATVVVVASSGGGGGGRGGGGGGGGVLAFLGGAPGSIASGLDATCGIVTGGQTWCFGKAPLIGVARDTSCFDVEGTKGDPSPCTLIPLQIASSVAFSAVAVGDSVACGVATGGAVYCWGDQKYGQVGNGIAQDGTPALPTRVNGPLAAAATFTQITAGATHACGLITDGSALCWGRDTTYQLGGGDNIAVSSSTPIWAAPGQTFKAITAGHGHTCGLTTAGVAVCWGDNRKGQLGRGAVGAPNDTAQAVSGSIVFTQLSAYRDNTCGVATGGAVYCWGANDSSQTGQAASAAVATPTAVSGTGYTYVAVGGEHVCALTATGISCWGANAYGQLGRGTAGGITPTPASVGGVARTYTALSSGARTSCAVAADGAYCWGSSVYGATGTQVQALAVLVPTKTEPPQ